ncbi:transcription factor FapR [Paenibacillus thermoaerophilus]|nr:transcription factor FapR [Paenibacillus thermoaerophilus]
MPKKVRQEQLKRTIEQNPFVTDEALMKQFGVSIQTIRLDRLELGIPEVRERIKSIAAGVDEVRSLAIHEVIGEVIDLQLDKSGISILEIGTEHVFQRTGIARGHHLFAQANSLAIALFNSDKALTASANIRYIRPVRLGERCVAKGYVRPTSKKGVARVDVRTYVGDELVVEGHFIIYRFAAKDEHELHKGGVPDAHRD